MNKRLLTTVLLFGLMSLSMFGASVMIVSAQALNEMEFTNIEIFSEAYFSNASKSIELSENIISKFLTEVIEVDGEIRNIFSDDYAGIWLDKQGFLTVGLVASNSYARSFQAQSGQVFFKQMTYSYNHLRKPD